MIPIHEDEHLLVLEKPSGLLSVPGRGPEKQDCLSKRVQGRYPEACCSWPGALKPSDA
jgi:tRNA pseudouridine32 synthase/23S rRNA pseudouridine746 synthase